MSSFLWEATTDSKLSLVGQADRSESFPARRSRSSPNRLRFSSKSSNHKKKDIFQCPLFYGRRLRIRTADPLGVNEML